LEVALRREKETESGHELIIEASSHGWNQRRKRLVIFAFMLFGLETLAMGNFTTLMLHAGQTIRWVVRVNFQKGRPAEVKAKIFIQLFELIWLDRSRAVYLKSVRFTFLRPVELVFVGKLPQNDGVTFMVGIFPLDPSSRLFRWIPCNLICSRHV
jgi:hypothetical protein